MKIVGFLIASLLVVGSMKGLGISGDEKDHNIGIPEKYQHMSNRLWNDTVAIAAGEKIYREKCLICHGENGDGQGPAAASSNIKPASFIDKNMVETMAPGYWFWRVAKGGTFPPFNSIMPPFEGLLTEEQIWQVISYEHTFSHMGLHEHKELKKATPHRHHEDESGQGKGEKKPSH